MADHNLAAAIPHVVTVASRHNADLVERLAGWHQLGSDRVAGADGAFTQHLQVYSGTAQHPGSQCLHPVFGDQCAQRLWARASVPCSSAGTAHRDVSCRTRNPASPTASY